jgi:peptidoglycan hydrolase CwlO-like protein
MDFARLIQALETIAKCSEKQSKMLDQMEPYINLMSKFGNKLAELEAKHGALDKIFVRMEEEIAKVLAEQEKEDNQEE